MEQVPVLLAISHLVIIRNEVIDFTARYSVIIKLMLLLLKDGGRRLIRSWGCGYVVDLVVKQAD